MNKNKNNTDIKSTEALYSLYVTFKNGLINHRATEPRDFLKTIGLDFQKLYLGFNSGQFHHNKDEVFKQPYIDLGVLIPTGGKGNAKDRTPSTVFAQKSIIFPLKNSRGEIVNYYGYRFTLKEPVGEYLNNYGVYPEPPSKWANRLFITDNIIDSATLCQCKILENRDSVISLKDGELTEDIIGCIEALSELEYVVLLTASNEGLLVDKLNSITEAKIVTQNLTDSDSLNEMYLKYGEDGLFDFIKEIKFEKSEIEEFIQVSDSEYGFKGVDVTYHILGMLSTNPTFMNFDFIIKSDFNKESITTMLNLYDTEEVKETIFKETENTNFNYNQIILELETIKSKFESLRINQTKEQKGRGFSVKQSKKANEILNSENLFQEVNQLIGESGVIGEEKSRLLLFIIASSFKFKYNLHAVVHSTNTEFGGELIISISKLIPEIDRYHLDITTSRTFRYYGNSCIDNKLLVIPDYTGITSSNAINDLKHLQAKNILVNDAPTKGVDGTLTTEKKEVLGHTSSIGCCKNSKKIFEGEPRTVLVKMDSSKEQENKLMEYDCLKMSGDVDLNKQQKAVELLHSIVNNLQPFDVINPFASTLMLPTSVRNARMLSRQLHSFVSLVTLFYQHQRVKDSSNKVVTTKEDIQIGVELFLEAIMLNIDDLDAGTRDFFDKLKELMLEESDGESSQLSSLDIQRKLSVSKSHVNRFLKTLVDNEYVRKEGHKNTGFNYTVTNWDEFTTVKNLIIDKLSDSCEPLKDGSPESL